MEQLAEFPKPDVRQQPRRIENPWGCERIWGHADTYVGKILHIAAGHALGLQSHRQKDETIHPWSGSMRCEYDRGEGRAKLTLKPGDSVRIRSGRVHGMVVLTATCSR